MSHYINRCPRCKTLDTQPITSLFGDKFTVLVGIRESLTLTVSITNTEVRKCNNCYLIFGQVIQ